MALAIPDSLTLDVKRIAAISLDLDDTLWPIWPTIERAERVLYEWLVREAPKTANLLVTPGVLRELREATAKERSDLAHDLSALRRESIRTALSRAGEDPALADPAFEVFFAERQRVTLYDDALPALKWLSERYPLVAVSNGNADVHLAGVGRWFRTAFNAREFGSGKPHAPIFRAAAPRSACCPRTCCTSATMRRSTWSARSMPACRPPGWCARSGPGSTARGRS
jgi:FMN phosphatase YigB (HAD superfamily)